MQKRPAKKPLTRLLAAHWLIWLAFFKLRKEPGVTAVGASLRCKKNVVFFDCLNAGKIPCNFIYTAILAVTRHFEN
ncbi:MAG: hypothetical protein LBH20_00560 [Treponema sp.]|jgi:hypothetical protein|nr:hypothetical protein [Treponema sp.]